MENSPWTQPSSTLASVTLPDLQRALVAISEERAERSAELARRARRIEAGRRRGRSWDETKREILGRPA